LHTLANNQTIIVNINKYLVWNLTVFLK
jgi:hypothetical protein